MKHVEALVHPTGGLVSYIQAATPKVESVMAETKHQHLCAPVYFPAFLLAKWGHVVSFWPMEWGAGLKTATFRLHPYNSPHNFSC